MTLLTQLLERPLDPGYAAAAAKRRAAGLPASRSASRPLAVAAAVLIGLLLATASLALRTPATVASSAKAQLVEEITARRTEGDALAARIASLHAGIDGKEASALRAPDQGALVARTQRLELATGEVAVRGPGVQLTLDDARSLTDNGSSSGADPRTASGEDQGRVLGADVQIVVNGLWQSGAEAIAVNGQRLTTRSAIRFAGEAILVDYRPLNRPYVITAIGDSASLQARFAASDAGAYVHSLSANYGIQSSIAGGSSLTLPASAVLSLRSARPGLGASAAHSPASTSSSARSSAASSAHSGGTR